MSALEIMLVGIMWMIAATILILVVVFAIAAAYMQIKNGGDRHESHAARESGTIPCPAGRRRRRAACSHQE